MIETLLTIVNPLGLHARPAAKLVDCCASFSSDITLIYDGKEIDAKSIMSVLMLAVPYGAQINASISGHDEQRAEEALQQLFASGFGELE